jgi:hypothetical protein
MHPEPILDLTATLAARDDVAGLMPLVNEMRHTWVLPGESVEIEQKLMERLLGTQNGAGRGYDIDLSSVVALEDNNARRISLRVGEGGERVIRLPGGVGYKPPEAALVAR